LLFTVVIEATPRMQRSHKHGKAHSNSSYRAISPGFPRLWCLML
jgi:hypothetical protein